MTKIGVVSSSWDYSQNLFQDEENRPLEFYVHPSVDSNHVIKLIKNGGGQVVCADHPRAIHIFSQMGAFKNGTNVSSSFIYSSCLENKLLDINSFRIQPEQFLASVVFQSLLEGIEKIFEKIPKERIVALVRLISSNENLWKSIAGSKEFEGSNAVKIRNTFNIWAFLNMRGGKMKHENLLSNLVSVVKDVAEEYCGCGNKIDAFEKHLNSAKKKSKSSKSLEKEDAERTLIEYGEGEQVRPLKSPETVNVPPSDTVTTEDLQERVVVKAEDCNAVMECDSVSDKNGSRECASVMCQVEDLENEEESAENCTEERTAEESTRDSNCASVKESEGTVEKGENSVNGCKENNNSEEIVECVKSGMWLGKNSMKRRKLSSKEREEPEADEDSSSSVSETEVKILKKIPPNSMYSYDEDLEIIKWVLKTRRCQWKVQGNRIWEYFEKKKILPNRSWQSMKERFKRRISTNLNRYELSDLDIKRLKKLL